MLFATQQQLQYSVSSGTTQHRTAKPRIRPNNQAPPHNALQHLAPTFTTPHYPISLHISPHHQTPSSISRNTLHRTMGPTNITYRPALSSTCAHEATSCYTMLHHRVQHFTASHYSAPTCTTQHHQISSCTTPHHGASVNVPCLLQSHTSIF